MANEQRQPSISSDAPERAGTPGPLRKTISTGLAEAGFGFLGSAFAEEFNDPSLAQPFQKMGENIVSTLHDRWYRKEYEDFVSMNGEAYKQKLGALKERVSKQFNMINRGVYVDPETGVVQKLKPESNEASFLKENLTREMYLEMSAATQEYMSAAGKYANNPYVNSEIQSILAQQTQDIQGLLGPSISTAQELGRAEMMEKREHAGYYSRMPAGPTGSETQAKFKAMTLQEIIEDKGISGAANYLTSTIDGQERLNPYKAGLGAKVEQSLIEEYGPDINLEAHLDLRKRLIMQREQDLATKSAGLALQEALGVDHPDLQRFFNTSVGRKYSPIKTDLSGESSVQTEPVTSAEIAEIIETAKDDAQLQIEDMIGNGASPTEAVETYVTELSSELNKIYGKTPANKKIKSAIINHLTKMYTTESKSKKGLLPPTMPGTNIGLIR